MHDDIAWSLASFSFAYDPLLDLHACNPRCPIVLLQIRYISSCVSALFLLLATFRSLQEFDNLNPHLEGRQVSIMSYLPQKNDYEEEIQRHHAPPQEIDPESGVKRGLKTRHLSMMALAGIIGPGLLVGSGGALASGGPASLLIGFGVIGIIAFSIMQSLGEITTLYPSAGAFTTLADRFVDKAFGVAVGWNYFIIWYRYPHQMVFLL